MLHERSKRDCPRSIGQIRDALVNSTSIAQLMQDEAVAGGIYFSSWSGRRVPFIKRDQSRVDPNWLTYDGRHSPLNPARAKNSCDPLNAALSFAYAILEANVRIACIAAGLDAGIGVLHGDQKGRDSAVLDFLEPLRPRVDAAVLTFLERRPLRKADLLSDARGVVRLRAPLTWEVISLVTTLGDDIARIVEQVADKLGASSPYDGVAVPRSKHRDAARIQVVSGEQTTPRAPVTGGTNRRKPRRAPAASRGPRRRCQGCGAVLQLEAGRAVARFAWCPECIPEHRAELAKVAQGASVGRTANAHDALATERRRAANAEQRLAEQAFKLAHDGEAFDRSWFAAEVLPKLQSVTTSAIARATGMSTSSASKVKRGLRVPHPRWWSVLQGLSRE